MSLALDPEVAAALGSVAVTTGPLPVGEWKQRRTAFDASARAEAARLTVPEGIRVEHHAATAQDGALIPLRIYRRMSAPTGGLVLYLHGGGHFCGDLDLSDTVCRQYVHMSGATLASVAYRLAPENPYPTGIEDAYAALLYLAEHASQLGGSPSRLAVMGESSGGGMAAGLALMARDRGGPSLVGQVLIYPMLDDRSVVPDAEIARFLTWTYDDNATGWMTLLGDAYGTGDVPVYAAPARASALSDLPATFIDVGELDAFRDEDVAYALRLARAGVPIELHVRPGAPHAFETIAPDAAITRRAVADRIRVLADV